MKVSLKREDSKEGDDVMNIVLLGPPGAGKGTQAKSISKRFNIPHISTGDMLREAISSNSELGKKVADIVERGDLVPDDLMIELVKERISREDASDGFILDGFPRTTVQAESLRYMLRQMADKIDSAIFIDVSEEKVVERISSRRVCPNCGKVYNLLSLKPKNDCICDECGSELVQRDDDKPETVRDRYEVYIKNTKSVVEFYKSQGKLKTFDGSKDIDELANSIIDYLENL